MTSYLIFFELKLCSRAAGCSETANGRAKRKQQAAARRPLFAPLLGCSAQSTVCDDLTVGRRYRSAKGPESQTGLDHAGASHLQPQNDGDCSPCSSCCLRSLTEAEHGPPRIWVIYSALTQTNAYRGCLCEQQTWCQEDLCERHPPPSAPVRAHCNSLHLAQGQISRHVQLRCCTTLRLH